MRQLLAILHDSLREAIDRRSLLVMLILSAIPILFCASLSFVGKAPEDVLRAQAEELNTFRRGGGSSFFTSVEFVVDGCRAIDNGDDFGAALGGGYRVDLVFPEPTALDGLAEDWFQYQRAPLFADPDEWEKIAVEASVGGKARELAFLEQRFADFGYEHVTAKAAGDAGRYVVAVRSDYPFELRGAYDVAFGFGLWNLPVGRTSIAELVIQVQSGIADFVVGIVGMLIALFATAAFVPNMLQKGTLDLVLARPISRTKLLLSKYLGGLWFVVTVATVLVTGCWIALWLGSGYNNPAFLLTILTLTLSFAVLYSVAVLFGVWSRSAGVSALAAIGTWWISSGLVNARHMLKMGFFGEPSDAVEAGLEVAYTVLPKVVDLDHLSTVALAQSHLSENARERAFGDVLPDVDWVFSLGTTGLFTAAVLGLALWLFHRRDY